MRAKDYYARSLAEKRKDPALSHPTVGGAGRGRANGWRLYPRERIDFEKFWHSSPSLLLDTHTGYVYDDSAP
jgi:hypothetical protein